jgi:hypothetical protein
MRRAALLQCLGTSLLGAAGCANQFPEYPLDDITVYVGFSEPICGGTFDWIEARLRWLEAETGLLASASPISFYWLREDLYDYCPSGACTSPDDNTFYSPLELFSHELVHGHLAQLGLPRPWLAEGMARMLEDARRDAPGTPDTPSTMLVVSKAGELDYDSAASFVGYLRDRYGMPTLLELYASLDRVDAQATPDVFLAVTGEDWDVVEDAYLTGFTPIPVGSLNCDFPEVAPENGAWTFPVDSPCEGPVTIGPLLGLDESFTPQAERYMTLEISEAGTYMATMTSSAKAYVALSDCDMPETYVGGELNDLIELLPGRKRLRITTDIADAVVGEIVLRGPLTTPLQGGGATNGGARRPMWSTARTRPRPFLTPPARSSARDSDI